MRGLTKLFWILWLDHSNESSLPVLTHGTNLFFKIWENEIGTFGWSLLLAKFGSERVKWRLSPYNLSLSKGTSYCQWRFSPIGCPMRICIHYPKWYEESFTGIDSYSHTALSSALVIYSFLLYRHECFTGKYTTRKIHKNYIRDPSGFPISHVSLSMT